MSATSITPTPYQSAVLGVPEQFNLLLGGGRGGGKSYGALLLVLRHVEQHAERARPLIIRETHKALLELEETLALLLGYAYDGVKHNRGEHVFRLPNGAVVELGQLADPGDFKKYQGRSFTLLLIEEFGAMRDHRYVGMLRSNLRAPVGMVLRTIYTANPGGRLHTYIHTNFVARAVPWHPFEMDGEQFVVCPSIYTDNPHIDHDDYVRKLRSACSNDEALLKAWLSGDWNIARGSFFAESLDQAVHQLPVEWPYRIDRRWAPYISLDWGSGAPSVTYFCLRAPGDVGPFAKDSLILIDEIATARLDDPNVGLNWPPGKLAEAIHERAQFWGIRPSGVGDDAKGLESTLLEVLQGLGIYLVRPQKQRVAGWAKMRELLHNASERNGRPGLYVSARCDYFWKTVPFLERDPNRPEDLVTEGPDHGADAARYAVMNLTAGRTGSGAYLLY